MPLKKIMTQLGYEPIKGHDNQIQYFSPYNQGESTPSFFIIKDKTTETYKGWFDHSTEAKGGVTKLVIDMFELNSRISNPRNGEIIARAYKINDLIQGGVFNEAEYFNDSFFNNRKDTRVYAEVKSKSTTKDKPVFLADATLSRPWLISYLNNRGITDQEALKEVVEISYRVGEKTYYSIACKNVNGGWNHRNEKVKGIIGDGGFSVFKHTVVLKGVIVFEGLIDYLSHIQLFGKDERSMYIVLNSTTSLTKAIAYISEFKYHMLLSYLDNGTSGDLATIHLDNSLPNVYDQRRQYAKHDDLNDFLCKKLKEKRELRIIKKKDKCLGYKEGKKLFEYDNEKDMKKEVARIRREGI